MFEQTLELVAKTFKSYNTLIIGGAVLRRNYISETSDIDVWIKFHDWEQIEKEISQPYQVVTIKGQFRVIRWQPKGYMPIDIIKRMTTITENQFNDYESRALIDPQTGLKFATVQDVLKIRRSVGAKRYNQKADMAKYQINSNDLTI